MLAFSSAALLPRNRFINIHLGLSPTRCRFPEKMRQGLCASAVPHFCITKLPKRTRQSPAGSSTTTGEVVLVGTGPGDPRLLTLGAVELLQTADVILYDRLVSDEILSFIHDGAERICVGKARGVGTGSQQTIQEQLLHHASQGKLVVRLKGGDPAIFGRLGDEIGYLREEGVDTSVVAGVTAASGIAASLGFPLTHGGVAESVRFFTGHMGAQAEFEIGQVMEGTTLVIYMGLRELRAMLQRFAECGARKDLPAVAVQSGTTLGQREVWGTVDSLPEQVEQAKLHSPTLLIIGEVVRMSGKWDGAGGNEPNGKQIPPA